MAKFQAQNEQDESQESKREDRVSLIYDRTSSMKSLEESQFLLPWRSSEPDAKIDIPREVFLRESTLFM